MVAIQVDPAIALTAWQIVADLPDFTDPTKPSVLDAFSMMMTIATAGYKCNLSVYQEITIVGDVVTPGSIILDLTITKDGYPDQPTIVGGYVVFDGVTAIVVDAPTYATNYTPRTG